MKKNIAIGIIGWLMSSIGGYKALAQDAPATENRKESQEIIIRKKGDKDTKVLVEITGDKVIINGKPLAEFNEDGVTINNRKMIIRDGDRLMMDFNGMKMDINSELEGLNALKNMKDFNFNFNEGEASSYTYIGVTTAKAEDGVRINSVSKNSPAEKAGLTSDDVIYKVDDTKITAASALTEYIRAKKEGDIVKVYYLRGGKKKDAKVTLGVQKTPKGSFNFSMPDGSRKSVIIPRPPAVPRPPAMPRSFNDGNFDFDQFRDISRGQKLGLKIQDTEEAIGVKVLDVESESAASAAGMMKEDIITEIGGVKISNTDEAREQLQINKNKAAYTVKAKRNGAEMTFNVKVPKNLKTTNL